MTSHPVIWEPDASTIERAELTGYLRWLSERGVERETYDDLWHWSIDDLAAFWTSVWDDFEVRGTRRDGHPR